MATEIVIKAARVTPPIDWRCVPLNIYLRFKDRVSAVCRSQHEAEDLVNWYGDAAFCPDLPVLLMVPGTTGIMLCGMGYATASELRDDAVALWVLKSERMQKYGALLDYDDRRERYGLTPRENLRDVVCEAFAERIKKHKRNLWTDPFRQMIYPNPTNRTLFQQPGVPWQETTEADNGG